MGSWFNIKSQFFSTSSLSFIFYKQCMYIYAYIVNSWKSYAWFNRNSIKYNPWIILDIVSCQLGFVLPRLLREWYSNVKFDSRCSHYYRKFYSYDVSNIRISHVLFEWVMCYLNEFYVIWMSPLIASKNKWVASEWPSTHSNASPSIRMQALSSKWIWSDSKRLLVAFECYSSAIRMNF